VSRIDPLPCAVTGRRFCSTAPLPKTEMVVESAKQDKTDRMGIIFTCDVRFLFGISPLRNIEQVCSTRSMRFMSRQAYYHGVVIMECFGCNNRHLIADHYGWFGEGETIEEILRKKGVAIQNLAIDGNISINPEDADRIVLAAEMEKKKQERERLQAGQGLS